MASDLAFKPANDETYKVCIFDTGASFHITADFRNLLEPRCSHVGHTVVERVCFYAPYMVSVQLHVEFVDSVLFITHSNVLCVPAWNEACFISC